MEKRLSTLTQIRNQLNGFVPKEGFDVAIILGSGLGDFVSRFDEALELPYAKVPGFPITSVQGHKGAMFSGSLNGKKVLAFAGRFHFYEGHNFETVLLPVHLAHSLGTKTLIVTNAAGGMNPQFNPGDLMLIRDLIFLRRATWLEKPTYMRYSGWNKTSDMAMSVSLEKGIGLKEGTYFFSPGPNYETKAEVRAFRKLGGDAVGMSTAPELIEAQHLGMNTLGISLITNKATGISKTKLNHAEVKETAEMAKDTFGMLIGECIRQL